MKREAIFKALMNMNFGNPQEYVYFGQKDCKALIVILGGHGKRFLVLTMVISIHDNECVPTKNIWSTLSKL